jgi:hypothetical protein
MDDETPSKWKTFHLRLDRDLHDRIGKSSKRHGRSMSAEVVARLERLYRPETNAALSE